MTSPCTEDSASLSCELGSAQGGEKGCAVQSVAAAGAYPKHGMFKWRRAECEDVTADRPLRWLATARGDYCTWMGALGFGGTLCLFGARFR